MHVVFSGTCAPHHRGMSFSRAHVPSRLDHDNIVKFLDSALDESHLVIIMELMTGQSLEDWLEHRDGEAGQGVTFADTQPIIRQLAQGMSAIHSLDIAHRDIKPGNFVFDEVTGRLVWKTACTQAPGIRAPEPEFAGAPRF